MKHRFLTISIIGLIGGLVGSAEAANVDLHQLNWLGPGGEVIIPASRVGMAVFTFSPDDPVDHQFLAEHGGGYINLTLLDPATGEEHWQVQNLYLVYPDEAYLAGANPSVQFALPVPNGQPMEFAMFGLSITGEPIEQPIPQMFEKALISLKDYHAGGMEGGGTSLSNIPLTIGPWVGLVFAWPVDAAWIWMPTNVIEKIDENTNHCMPGAVARSIHYLGTAHGFPTDDAQQIYEDLANKMGTTKEEGTFLTPGLNGKNAYTAQKGLPINTRYVPDNIDDETAPPPTEEQMDEVLNDLANGCDVEIKVGWNGGGGHSAMVTSIVKLSDGSYIITYVDDPNQGDGKAENQENTIRVRPDGTFGRGNLWGFMVECVKQPTPGDLNGDGVVDGADLLILLSQWGECDDPDNCPADLNGDGVVDGADLLVLLSNWG